MTHAFGFANAIVETQKKRPQEICATTEFPAVDVPGEAVNH